ncbi:hypothetical protein [Lewinella sp. IMCC34183]|uniref:hypothetical protein n=1 Tax=Lewinella sp. IMCC34183 TaxID=2248762 RepID=UPI000E22003A|nr:hypothetical protein [Lewinella sp. IMCC34183]
MYTNWLTPPPPPVADLPGYALGHRLSATPPQAARFALIGASAAAADGIRRHLHAYAWDFGVLPLTDLGNLRKQTVEFTIPLLRECFASGLLPVVLGGTTELLRAQYLAFAELNRQVGLCHVDSTIRLRPEGGGAGRPAVLDSAVHRDRSPSFHLAHLGSQRHLVDPRLDGLFLRRHFERVTLGQSRGQLSELEPAIRDADVLAFDLSALSATEAPAQRGRCPSGLTVQEAGQVVYYGGNSDRLASFGLYGYTPDGCTERERTLTEAAQAQLVWYFLHGVSRRAGDFPATTEGLVEYVVDSKVTDRLTFWRSARSNRWWVQVPVEQVNGEERNRLVACSYDDYLKVSQQGQLPERLHLAFSRY